MLQYLPVLCGAIRVEHPALEFIFFLWMHTSTFIAGKIEWGKACYYLDGRKMRELTSSYDTYNLLFPCPKQFCWFKKNFFGSECWENEFMGDGLGEIIRNQLNYYMINFWVIYNYPASIIPISRGIWIQKLEVVNKIKK